MVHSRDDKEVDMAHEVKSPKNQPQFSQTIMGSIGKTISQKNFQIDLKGFQKVATEF